MTPASPARVETLPRVPELGALYARGVAASARLAAARRLGRGGDASALPDVVYRVAGLATGDGAGGAGGADGAPGSARHLAAYQEVVGEAPGEVLPAGYLHVLGFPLATALMVRDDFPLPLLGMVHLSNAVSVLRPVRLGDSLEVRARAEDLRPHRRGAQVDLVTEIFVERTEDQRTAGSDLPATTLAYRGVSTYLAKGVRAPGTGAGTGSGGTGSDGTDPSPATGADGAPDAFEVPLPTARWRLGAGVGRAYAAVSGDRNPIHTSALGARAFGFPRAIAHGMYTAARALAEVGPSRPDAYDWTAQFAKPVLLPGTVDVAIRPTGAGAGADAGWTYAAWGRGGTLHLRGTVTPR